MLKSIRSDKKRVYIACFILLCCLPIALFISYGQIISAIFLGFYALAVSVLFKKRDILSLNKRQVLLLVPVLSVLFLICYYLLGVSFGFNATAKLNKQFIFTGIIPIIAIIISTEISRKVFLATNSKIVYFLMLAVGVITDLIIKTVFRFSSFDGAMYIIGIVAIPSIMLNVFLNYLSKRYGILPGMIYRLIMTLYVYIIPVVPNIQDALLSFLKIIAPLIAISLINLLFDNKRRFQKHKKKTWVSISTALLVAVMTAVVMLISCQFRFGAIVIATESMTGEINKGDVVIFEQYNGQQISEGQVIIFNSNGGNIVHRVVEIKNENGIVMYFTKGDANEDIDDGFVTESQIVGITHFRIAYIGYPTVWLRNIFG